VQTSFRRIHIEKHDQNGSVELDVSGETFIQNGGQASASDRPNLKTNLSGHHFRAYAKHTGRGYSSASSHSSCGSGDIKNPKGHGKAQATTHAGSRLDAKVRQSD
jgi:hypothetical protein